MTLRPYQQNVVSRIIEDMANPYNSVVVMPTGSGKSLIVAEIARQLQKPILILQPSAEILSQNKEKLSGVVGKDEIGVYSASMNEKTIRTYTLATIGSIYKSPSYFSHFKLVLIDECHLVNHKKLSTMFMSFLRQIGNPKVIGLTATPYRMETWGEKISDYYFLSHAVTKMINRCQNPFWSKILVSLNIGDLIDAGYLCKPSYCEVSEIVDRNNLSINSSHTDFDLTEFQRQISGKTADISESLEKIRNTHKHTLVFCVSVLQAEQLSELVLGSAVVSAQTPKKLRRKIIDDFKCGKIRVVFNVECLTTGFDFPSLDAIVVLRPTNSIRLHVQMLGRGVRIADGKKTCNIYDFVGNVKKIGRVETVKVVRLVDGWNIISETDTWHNKELYEYLIEI